MNKLTPIFLLFIVSCAQDPEPESFEVNKISDCDRMYYETTYNTSFTTTEDAYLKNNRISGKITFVPQKQKSNSGKVTFGMDQGRFIQNCSAGNKGIWSKACPYYQQCMSMVSYVNSEEENKTYKELNYQETATYIKENTPQSPSTDSTVASACGVVARTYSATTVADSIFAKISEISWDDSRMLGEKAVEGFGECLCAIDNHLNRKGDYSIGYCTNDIYTDY